MRRPDLDVIAEVEQLAQGRVERLRALGGLVGEIRARDVAHQQGVSGDQQPRVVPARTVSHEEAQVLGAVAGRADRPDHERTDRDLVPRSDQVGRPFASDRGTARLSAGCLHERGPARDVVGVLVGVDHMGDPQLLGGRRLQVHVDRPAWVDDHSLAGVADDVGRTTQIAIQHLAEEQIQFPSSNLNKNTALGIADDPTNVNGPKSACV